MEGEEKNHERKEKKNGKNERNKKRIVFLDFFFVLVCVYFARS